jgi:predicted glycosyltransferase
MRSLRVVAYAVNGSDLGHLTRVLAILRWARRLARLAGYRLEAYVLTSSEGCALAFAEGFAAFKIPSKTAIRQADIPKRDYLRLAKQWVWHSLGLIDPDILLVDTFPGGSFGELLHALDGLRARVFIYRSMKESFAQTASVQALLPVYDCILVPLEPGCTAPHVDNALRPRVRHVGPILLRTREELHPCTEARIRLGIPPGKLAVWLSAGGGGDATADSTLNALIDALTPDPALHLVVGAGPLYRSTPRRGPNLTWLQGFHAMQDFTGLDCALAAAGYNSFHELLHAGVPTAFFAQEKIADEQSRRIAAAVQEGAALALAMDATGRPVAASLADALAKFKDPHWRALLRQRAGTFVPVNCAREAAYEMLATLLPETVLADAVELGTPALFQTMAHAGVDFSDVEKALALFASVRGVEPSECAALLTRLLASDAAPPLSVLRLFPVMAHSLAHNTPEDLEELVEACLQAIAMLMRFGSERAAAALLELARPDCPMRATIYTQALSAFLDALSATGDSLWRGMSILAKCQGAVDGARSVLTALRAARHEILMEAQEKGLTALRPHSGGRSAL